MVGSDRYGFYAGLIPPQTNTLAGSKPPQRGGVLNPPANKREEEAYSGILRKPFLNPIRKIGTGQKI
jgi:hypothetical protein